MKRLTRESIAIIEDKWKGPFALSCCPCCEGDIDDVQYGTVEIEGDYARQQCMCTACRLEWDEYYKRDGITINQPSE